MFTQKNEYGVYLPNLQQLRIHSPQRKWTDWDYDMIVGGLRLRYPINTA